MTPQDITLLLYNLAVIPVAFFSVLFFLFTIMNLFMDGPEKRRRAPKEWPFVTVQVPTFNDVVALRCINACLKLDYPADKFQIMIIDDSTDQGTAKQLKAVADKHPGKIRFVHRKHRRGYKPGALKDAMHLVKGDIITILDADFIPPKHYLKRLVPYFQDPKVAIVQGRQTFVNAEVNLISRMAAYLLMVLHIILMPINNKFNTVLFCGTAGALRKSAIKKVGGWNTDSITEDADLSIKLLSNGYKSIYVKLDVPSEVPVTLESLIKQHMRWAFGVVRVFFDHWRLIWFSRKLKFAQRVMISFLTLGNIIAPFVIFMTVFGFLGWFFGDPHLFDAAEVIEFILKFVYTLGFLFLASVMLKKDKKFNELPHLIVGVFSVSIVLAVSNSVAVFKAIFMKDKPLFTKAKNSWIVTPKSGNADYLKP